MRRTRPTICPTRPKPAIITRLSWLSTRSNSRCSRGESCGSIKFACSDMSSGLTIIEMVTTMTSISASDGSITRWVTASENSTKPNSPACGNANAMPRALSPECFVSRAISHNTSELHDQQSRHEQRDAPWLIEQQAEVGGHADRHEEQAEQQPLERLDVGFELVAVLAVGQQQTGDESAERHRHADRIRPAARCRCTTNSAAAVNASPTLVSATRRSTGRST